MRKNLGFAVVATTALLLTSCSQNELNEIDATNHIVASIQTPATTRTVVDVPGNGTNTTGILWTDGDALGVFDASATSQKQYVKVGSGNVAVANFTAATATQAFETPVYAYYPYNAANDGKDISALTGTLPAVQNMDDGMLHGDYKYGRAKKGGTAAAGHEFVFTHLFSLARITIDAENTPLKGEKLKSVSVSVTRGETKVPIAGNFSFNGRNGNWTQTDAGETGITLEWTNETTLDQAYTCYTSLFPNIHSGDIFNIEVKTENYKATFTATSLTNFAREQIYNFPMSLNNYASIKVYDAAGNLIQNGPDYSQDTDVVTGTFTCAALNVDGLPNILGINKDGPGADGTTTIGEVVNNLGWDFMAVSEDFEYNDKLAAALANYNAGKWRGTITALNTSSLNRADTDGLNFFWKKNGITATGETMVQFTAEEGGLTGGANTCIKKGFRHYEVTVAEGVTVDVYITHMNTYSGDGNTEDNKYVAAQLAQLRQIRDYVLAIAKEKKRPAIIMGDTNMRYTRHNIATNFITPVTAEGFTVADPWVEFRRGGIYPTWNTKSLMIRSMFKGDKENDIVCSDDQRGEVVDKMWYINVPGATVQLQAVGCRNDVENFVKSTEAAEYKGVDTEDANGNILTNQTVSFERKIGLADHFPVVVDFKYTIIKK